jgi:toxin ParE1/3/4
MRVVWTLQAQKSLLLVRQRIKTDNRKAAARIANRLRISAQRLAIHPESGRPGRVDSTRELVVPGTHYILPYRVRHDRVEILSVIHGAQKWPEIL